MYTYKTPTRLFSKRYRQEIIFKQVQFYRSKTDILNPFSFVLHKLDVRCTSSVRSTETAHLEKRRRQTRPLDTVTVHRLEPMNYYQVRPQTIMEQSEAVSGYRNDKFVLVAGKKITTHPPVSSEFQQRTRLKRDSALHLNFYPTAKRIFFFLLCRKTC